MTTHDTKAKLAQYYCVLNMSIVFVNGSLTKLLTGVELESKINGIVNIWLVVYTEMQLPNQFKQSKHWETAPVWTHLARQHKGLCLLQAR